MVFCTHFRMPPSVSVVNLSDIRGHAKLTEGLQIYVKEDNALSKQDQVEYKTAAPPEFRAVICTLDQIPHAFPDKERVFQVGTSMEYERVFKRIIIELQRCQDDYEEMLVLLLRHLLITFHRELTREHILKNEYLDQEMNTAVTYFSENYNQDINIEDYAASRGMSVSWFIRGGTVFTAEEAKEVANRLGYPVLVRPSYVLGGQGMQIAINDHDIDEFIGIINRGKDCFMMLFTTSPSSVRYRFLFSFATYLLAMMVEMVGA